MVLYPWQTDDWTQIAKQFDRVPNAWLLAGPKGIGKAEFARQLAKSLLCDHPNTQHHACNNCESCRWFESQTHPDFRWLQVQEQESPDESPSKAGKTRLKQIKIEDIRDVIEFATLSPHRRGRKVVVLYDADKLNISASNALLKVLEEPSEDLVFIVVANAVNAVIPTIRSRCRLFSVHAPSEEQALAWLQKQNIPNAVFELAHHGGRPVFQYDAAQSALLADFVKSLAEPSVMGLMGLAEKLDKQKPSLQLETPLAWLNNWLYDLLSQHYAGKVRFFPEGQAQLAELAEKIDPMRVFDFQKKLAELVPFGRHTLSFRLQMESLLLQYLTIVM